MRNPIVWVFPEGGMRMSRFDIQVEVYQKN